MSEKRVPEVAGKIEHPFEVAEDTIVRGMLTAGAKVLAGATLELYGMIVGDLIVEPDGRVFVRGAVDGAVRNRGGSVVSMERYSRSLMRRRAPDDHYAGSSDIRPALETNTMMGAGWIEPKLAMCGHPCRQRHAISPEPPPTTAAHCLPHFPPCHGASYLEERTYAALLAPLGGTPAVWAECLFADPVGDIAVLGSPDSQVLWDEAAAYDELMQHATPLTIADAPDEEGPAWLLSLAGEWFPCPVNHTGGIAVDYQGGGIHRSRHVRVADYFARRLRDWRCLPGRRRPDSSALWQSPRLVFLNSDRLKPGAAIRASFCFELADCSNRFPMPWTTAAGPGKDVWGKEVGRVEWRKHKLKEPPSAFAQCLQRRRSSSPNSRKAMSR